MIFFVVKNAEKEDVLMKKRERARVTSYDDL